MVSKPHKTRRIPLKTIYVDEKIVPIVQWLNSFKGVTTEWCCQGDDPVLDGHGCQKWPSQAPYVTFYCTDTLSLITILQAMGRCGETKVEFYENALRYNTAFTHPHGFDAIINSAKSALKEKK